jgi:hypothetical protein
MSGNGPPTEAVVADQFENAIDDVEEAPREAHTVHRIRANSSIMQLKKLLGELGRWRDGCGTWPRRRRWRRPVLCLSARIP